MPVVFYSRRLRMTSLTILPAIWLLLCCASVNADSLEGTVTKARCIANCYTLYGSRNSDSENVCPTTACQQCLSLCGKNFVNETLCLQSCNNSNSCETSCRFLGHLKTFSSVLSGDGSKSPTPVIPRVTNETLNSITLEWDPVRNTSGTPVYIIGIIYDGDWKPNSRFFKGVFTVPRGTLETKDLCYMVPKVGLDSAGRHYFNGIYYKFRIVIVTDNSSASYGAETRYIVLPMPGPVSNITVTSIFYDSNKERSPKLKLLASWSPPAEDANAISSYAIRWIPTSQCSYVLPAETSTITAGAQTRGSIYFDEKISNCQPKLLVYALNKCTPSNGTAINYYYPSMLKHVYALNKCTPSNGTAINYYYPGCRNTTNYPREDCYKFDPPEAPNDDKGVRNITYRVASINSDYTFSMNVTWDPPVYPYKRILLYKVFWKILNPGFFSFPKTIETTGSSVVVGPLTPDKAYAIIVLPKFEDDVPFGFGKNISVPSREIDPSKVTVRNLKLDDFTFSPQTSEFELNVTWEKPAFNYSVILAYLISYQVNEGNVIATSTDKTYFQISGILHEEPVSFNVTPNYRHYWIKGRKNCGKNNAPAALPDELIVRNLLMQDFIITPHTGKYDLNVTWEEPLFNFSRVFIYLLSFRIGSGEEHQSCTNKTFFIIRGISHGESVEFKIETVYNNRRIVGIKERMTSTAPLPEDEIKVKNLQAGMFLEDQASNTFAVNFTWDPPPFQYSTMLHYNLSYDFSGYPRDHFPCSGVMRKGFGCLIKNVLEDTSYQISGIFPQEHITVWVVPVYDDKYIKGKQSKVEDNAPAPRGELLKVVALKHSEIVPSSNRTFRTTVMWEKPLFTHSAVRDYTYKITKKNESQIQRRAIDFNNKITTRDTNVTIDGIILDEEIVLQVTPVFELYTVVGIESKISVLKTEPSQRRFYKTWTPGEISGLVIGLLLLTLIVISLMICQIRKRKKENENGLVSGSHALMIDHWEVDVNLVSLEEEIGEGAFGKVYRGTLKELPTHAQRLFLKPSKNSARSIDGREMFTVAVKMLHNISDSDQRRDFLDEIQLMKAVGSHKNIVTLVGCCTVGEPMLLLTEYAPYGNLLGYLRKHRRKAKENIGSDTLGPYRSTYCETYFSSTNPTGISVKATKVDRVYVNAPGIPNDENSEDIQLVSFNSTSSEDHDERTGEENEGLDVQEREREENEEVLTPGHLMAFAWQVTKGMEYLAKKGFVHRDLAARNVLVGEHKVAKVSDFGLTRHVYEEQVYYAKQNRKLPLKWMSIEAIFDQTFTTQSDVWAFGVLLWELVTLGGTPYPTIDNKELLRLLKQGYRMEKPDTCSDELYEMMTDCWKESPEARSTFTQIRERLETMMQKDNPYLDLTAVDETCAYYNVPSFNSVTEESTSDGSSDINSLEPDEDDKKQEDSDDYKQSTLEGTVKQQNKSVTEKDPQMLDSFIDIDNRIQNDLNDENIYSTKNVQDPNDVRVNIQELERSVYRPAMRGLAF